MQERRAGRRLPEDPDILDLAIVGAGAAGTYVAHALIRERPAWSIALFERTDRIGGRLRSLRIPGIDHPVELGGMRFLTSHQRVGAVVDTFGLATHPFVEGRGPDRFLLRGRFSDGAMDSTAGAAYDLAEDERGRSAADLLTAAFERIVPGAMRLDHAGWSMARATHEHAGRPLTDRSIGDALASVLSPEGHRFVTDAFGYDSGLRGQNAGDAIPYLLGAGDPTARARVPDDGMDALPRALAEGFVGRGGALRPGHDLRGLEVDGGLLRLAFADGRHVRTRRVVLAMAAPALRMLAGRSPVLRAAPYDRVLRAVDAWQAAKLYLWYDQPWWRQGFTGIRMTTDLAPRKLFYFDDFAPGPAALLATYTDGIHTEPWRALHDGSAAGSEATPAMLELIEEHLRAIHPSLHIPPPAGSAFIHWGKDPHETGWHYWRAGAHSDDVVPMAPLVDPAVELYICGEAFSRAQAWVEGAFETAEAVVRLMTNRAT